MSAARPQALRALRCGYIPASMKTTCTCIALRTAARKVTALYDEALAASGLNIAQYSLLRKIQRAKTPPSLTQLSRLADLDRSTVGRNLRVLGRMELVSVRPGKDQREATVHLEDKGLALLDACEPQWAQAQKTLEERIGAEAVAVLRRVAAEL